MAWSSAFTLDLSCHQLKRPRGAKALGKGKSLGEEEERISFISEEASTTSKLSSWWFVLV